MLKKVLLILFVSTWSFSFSQTDTLKYLFIGHPNKGVQNSDQTDVRLESADFTEYNNLWLGGDLCGETSLKFSTIQSMSDLFNLSKPGNHLTFGNHDVRNGNLEWYKEITGKDPYYSYSANNGLTVIVLNGSITPLDCDNINKQYWMIKNVVDTIQSGHLIFLVHTGITYGVPGVMNPSSYAHTQLIHWRANCFDSAATYINSIYPLLVELELKGVQVKQIVGDVGAGLKTFYGISDDGVEIFGSGLNNSYDEIINGNATLQDSVLLFKHVPENNYLGWEFIPVTDL